MTEAVEQLKTRASDLSAPEREELAYFLLSSLENEDEGAQEHWQADLARRVADIRNGTAIGRSAEVVLAELRERYP